MPAWEWLLSPPTFGGALIILLTSVVAALAALGMLTLGWRALERRERWRGSTLLVIGAVILLALGAYWFSRPFARGAV